MFTNIPIHFSRLLIKTWFIVVLCMTQALAEPAIDIKSADIPALNDAHASLFTSGQPSREALEILAKNGLKHVINLRPAAEMDWDEQAWVESLGMQYHSIPVAGAKGITPENATKLRHLLSTLEKEPTLLHCSSSNRVGGLRALMAYEDNGGNVDAAIEAGQQWGLTGLADQVRQQLTK